MKKSDTKLVAILISFVALNAGVILIATQLINGQVASVESKLLQLGCQVKSFEIRTPITIVNLSESQFLDEIRVLNATTVYYQYYAFYILASNLTLGYRYYVT